MGISQTYKAPKPRQGISALENNNGNGDTGSGVSPEALEGRPLLDNLVASFNKNTMLDFRSVDLVQRQTEIIYYPTSPQTRYIEIFESSSFLFVDSFMKNLMDSFTSL